MIRLTQRALSALCAVLALASSTTAQPALNVTDVFVGNQGRPASLTAYRPGETTATQLFTNQISGFLQGTELMNGRLYVTGNGTRIDVVDPATRTRVAQITDAAFSAARYFAQATPTKAYVTTQNYASGASSSDVVVLDLANNTVAGRITVPLQPEGIAVSGGRAFVALGAFSGRPALAVIDVATDAVAGEVSIGCNARFVLADDDGEIHAVCNSTGEVVVVNAASLEVVRRVAVGQTVGSAFGIGQDAVLVAANPSAGTPERLLLATSTGVVFVSTDADAVGPTVTIAEASTRPVSALAFDSSTDRLYLGRPDASGPFSAAGTLTVHEAGGALVRTLTAGVFPSHITLVGTAAVSTERGPLAGALRLGDAFPNPARAGATLPLSLGAPADVRVVVFDALGREVATWQASLGAGVQALPLPLSGLRAGLYVVRVEAGGEVGTARVTVAR
ncbi:MAG: DUF5074 domain-containing protein [Rubricoccaceae bacterium]